MFHVSNICKNYSFTSNIAVQVRNKAKTHWAKLKKKTSPKYKALNHFDDFYASVFGSKWEPMRQALLRGSKYVAIVNNYGDAEETIEYLTHRGAHCLKNLMKVQQEFHNEYSPKSADPPPINNTNKLQEYVNRVQSEDISSLYPEGADTPDRLSFKDKKPDGNERILHINKSDGEGKQSMNYPTSESQLDESRIIDPSMGMSSEVLYQYIPATKLKGMDEWIPESLHYSYYSTDKDFPLVIEPETEFQIPEHLKVYTYEMDSEYHKFPEPKRCKTGVFNYYPMDCGSVLAVLALCLSPGDRVLDLCAAPGGKSLVALQTLLPDIVVCNDTSISRHNRMERIFNDYLFDFKTSNKWRERVLTTRVDGRIYKDDQGFDKVLVDVPCTTDRLSVNEDENNVFRPDRVRERLKLPEMQSQLLTNALRLVRPGGAVVYSTCSLSPVQNDGVVHAALKRAFEEYGVLAAVKDLTIPMSALSSTLLLATGDIAPRYGQLVLPSVSANFGPSYLARLVRIK
ncbi:5-methylcytosine rRNA methyltransferase nsun-4 [Ostrinia nubilalis]|uniref:5-methylcytosine rRNA methyltransferase nsun-4 n=1 Tax=Ostrinia nubilalis TaxID=29057 RepID=UPI0030822DC6